MTFLAARITAVAIKPCALWWLLKNNYQEHADFVSLYYLAAQLSFYLLNGEHHRDFYKTWLNHENFSHFSKVRSLHNYLMNTFHHSLIFGSLVFLILLQLFPHTQTVAAGVFICIALEKAMDEFLRFTFYTKNYISWSVLILLRTFLPILTFIGLTLLLDASVVWFVFSLCFFLICAIFYFFYKYLPPIKIYRFKPVAYLTDRFVYNGWVIVYAAIISNVLVFDKLLIYLFDHELAKYTLVSGISMLATLAYDTLVLAPRKPDFLSPSFRISDAGFNRSDVLFNFLLCSATGLMITLLSAAGFLELDISFIVAGLLICVGLFFYNLTLSTSLYTYWQLGRQAGVAVEGASFIVVIIILLCLEVVHVPTIAAVFLTFNVIRVCFYLLVISWKRRGGL